MKWQPTCILAYRPAHAELDRFVEVMLLKAHREAQLGAIPAYTQQEWAAQLDATWARGPNGRWLKRTTGGLAPFRGHVLEIPLPLPEPAQPAPPQRLLVVDDDQRLGDALLRALRTCGPHWSGILATSGAEALALAQAHRFTAVISDRAMPGMDGRALLTQLAREHPRMIRILLTGSGSIASLPAAHRVLFKPCPAPVLVRTLEECAREVA